MLRAFLNIDVPKPKQNDYKSRKKQAKKVQNKIRMSGWSDLSKDCVFIDTSSPPRQNFS